MSSSELERSSVVIPRGEMKECELCELYSRSPAAPFTCILHGAYNLMSCRAHVTLLIDASPMSYDVRSIISSRVRKDSLCN